MTYALAARPVCSSMQPLPEAIGPNNLKTPGSRHLTHVSQDPLVICGWLMSSALLVELSHMGNNLWLGTKNQPMRVR